jgi:hypothetical protein
LIGKTPLDDESNDKPFLRGFTLVQTPVETGICFTACMGLLARRESMSRDNVKYSACRKDLGSTGS